ncbi:MAG: DNA internalization-related competence protein ComEC/Rec2 [Phycisphaerales bacterium JB063]
MLGSGDTLSQEAMPVPGQCLLVRLALAWIAGAVAGWVLSVLWWWVALSGAALLLSVVVGWRRAGDSGRSGARRRASAMWLALVAVSCVSASWLIAKRDYISSDTVARFVSEEGALARVRGTVVSSPRDVSPTQGSFGDFNFRTPGTLFELEVDAIDAGGGFEPASGAILVRTRQHDHRLALGQRIEASGWLSAIGETQNPGEFDYRAYLAREGVHGRMTLIRRGNWRELAPPPRWTLLGIRRAISDAAAASLRLGLPHDPERTGLLEALLLGRRTSDIKDLSESFRAVGLAHVLSISGAHLGILLVLVWWLGRLLIGRPTVVAWIVLAVLVLFLLAVPWRTPIVRAAVMAWVFCAGYGLGRRLRGIEMLAAAALIVLVWKPTDLFTAGFQLSFGAVGGLLLFSRPVSLWLWPEPTVQVIHPTATQQAVRWLVDFVAVSLVAFAVAVPLVMYHFQLVSPLAALLSLFALPVLTALLGVGYLKVLLGLLLPSASSLLAMPVAWLADSMVALVAQSERLPASSFPLANQPTVAWTAGAMALVVAVMAGWFRRRWAALLLALSLLVGLGVWEQRAVPVRIAGADDPAVEVVMFGVGDGSCYLLRSGGRAMMYDCGSQAFLRIGERSIVPALSALGVSRLEVLMLSHPDLDHYVGTLDVLDGIEVGEVVVSAEMLRDAAAHPEGATAFLLAGLRERGYEPTVAGEGWSMTLGDAALTLLWPVAGFESDANNDHSLVLACEAGGRRVLLNGDIQGEAIAALLGSGVDLRADVTDLPHHGSWVAESPAWLEAVDPLVALQSSGPRRPDEDRWAQPLEAAGVPRLTTNTHGMVHLAIARDGRIVWEGHRGGGGVIAE